MNDGKVILNSINNQFRLSDKEVILSKFELYSDETNFTLNIELLNNEVANLNKYTTIMISIQPNNSDKVYNMDESLSPYYLSNTNSTALFDYNLYVPDEWSEVFKNSIEEIKEYRLKIMLI